MSLSSGRLTASHFLFDIRFWIILYFILRLYGIWLPPLETGHNWRQTTVTMAARNFLESNASILYPKVDMAGEKTGITGMEFPVFNYLIYLFSEIFGYEHWYGRLINLIVSSMGILFFYRLSKKITGERTAFFAGFVLLNSLWFTFSRKIMPDTFATSLAIIALYYGYKYLYQSTTAKNLILFTLLACTSILSKLPVGYLFIPLGLTLFDTGLPLKKKIITYSCFLAACVPVFWWYFIWVPHLNTTYGYEHFFMGKSIIKGATEIVNNPGDVLRRFYETPLGYAGFITFLAGIFFIIKNKQRRLLYISLTALAGFIVVILKAGFTFYHHNYYILPFIPVMALVAGYGIAGINIRSATTILLLIIAVEGIGRQFHDFRLKEKQKALLSLERDLNRHTEKEGLIIINSGEYPTPMYFAHRKGWLLANHDISGQTLDSLKNHGAEHLVILKKAFGQPLNKVPENLSVRYESEDYDIYKIKER